MGSPSLFSSGSARIPVDVQSLREILGSATVAELVSKLPLIVQCFVRCVAYGVQLYDAPNDLVRIVSLHQDEKPPNAEINIESVEVQEKVEHGYPASDSPLSVVLESESIVYLEDLSEESRFSQILDVWRRSGVKSLIYIPLRTDHGIIGALFCGSHTANAFSSSVTELLGILADHVALAVSHCITHERDARSRRELAHERDRFSTLLQVAKAIASELDTVGLMRALFQELRKYFDHQFGTISTYSEESDALEPLYVDLPVELQAPPLERRIPMHGSVSGEAVRAQRTVFFRLDRDEGDFPWTRESLARFQFRWACAIPLTTVRGRLGVLNLGGSDSEGPSDDQIRFLEQMASHLALALERTKMLDELRSLNEHLEWEKIALQDEIRGEINFEEIVGRSQALNQVLRQLEVVAATDATVLVLGESGTGKELIARAIHRLSRRAKSSFVKINCAAIPLGLLESELFGHEKGAFTGAIAQKLGRFELADHGTIFLDEVGEIPIELQPKLLHVLQEMEFQRLGSHRTIHVDVRVVAATNRDLKEMVRQGQFREDLYYRINVFPLTVPPLRERREDIPLLVRFFVQEMSRKLKRNVTQIPESAMSAMQSYPWPGNVRELQNFVERAVILSPGSTLNVPMVELGSLSTAADGSALTLNEAERRIILEALEVCGWVIGGPRGAASRLGMKRTTLQSRMEKLGIRRP